MSHGCSSAPGPRKGSQYDLVSRSQDEYIGNLSETYPISIPTYIYIIQYYTKFSTTIYYRYDCKCNFMISIYYIILTIWGGKQNRREQLSSLEAQLSFLVVCEIGFTCFGAPCHFPVAFFFWQQHHDSFHTDAGENTKMVYGGGPPMLRFGVFVRRWPWYLNNMCSLTANFAKVSGKYYPPWVLLSQAHSYTLFCLPIQHT